MCDTERQLAAVFVAMMTEYVTRKDMQWQITMVQPNKPRSAAGSDTWAWPSRTVEMVRMRPMTSITS